jgi:hypothetical protein
MFEASGRDGESVAHAHSHRVEHLNEQRIRAGIFRSRASHQAISGSPWTYSIAM